MKKSRQRRRLSLMPRMSRTGNKMSARSERMSAVGGRVSDGDGCREDEYIHVLTSWQMATALGRWHCGLGLFFQPSWMFSQVQKSCEIKKRKAAMKAAASHLKRRRVTGSGSMRMMEKRMESRAVHMTA